MPALIRNSANQNQPIITQKNGTLSRTYFNLVRLGRGEEYRTKVAGVETVYVVMTGNVDIQVDGTTFRDVGRRKDIWSGNADSVYAGAGSAVQVRANAGRDGNRRGGWDLRHRLFALPSAAGGGGHGGRRLHRDAIASAHLPHPGQECGRSGG